MIGILQSSKLHSSSNSDFQYQRDEAALKEIIDSISASSLKFNTAAMQFSTSLISEPRTKLSELQPSIDNHIFKLNRIALENLTPPSGHVRKRCPIEDTETFTIAVFASVIFVAFAIVSNLPGLNLLSEYASFVLILLFCLYVTWQLAKEGMSVERHPIQKILFYMAASLFSYEILIFISVFISKVQMLREII